MSVHWRTTFEAALPYQPFLAKYARPQKDLPRGKNVCTTIVV